MFLYYIQAVIPFLVAEVHHEYDNGWLRSNLPSPHRFWESYFIREKVFERFPAKECLLGGELFRSSADGLKATGVPLGVETTTLQRQTIGELKLLREEIRLRDQVHLADEDLVRLSQLIVQHDDFQSMADKMMEKLDYDKLSDLVASKLAPLLTDGINIPNMSSVPASVSSTAGSSNSDIIPMVEDDPLDELSPEDLSLEETSTIEKQRLTWRDILRPSEKGQPVFSLLQKPMRFPSKYSINCTASVCFLKNAPRCRLYIQEEQK